jgi:signal transduction histidine kinase
MEVKEKMFLLSRQDTTRTENFIIAHSKNVNTITDTLSKLIGGNRVQYQNLVKLRDDINQRFIVMEQAVTEALQTNTNTIDLYEAKEDRAMQKLSDRIEKMENEEIEHAGAIRTKKEYSESVAPNYVELIIAQTIIFQGVSFLFMLVEFKRRKLKEKELELKIIQLDCSRGELEQIAFVASHDLKEPLRKIRLFNNVLCKNTSTDKDSLISLAKIEESAEKMQGLLDDLLEYIGLARANENIRLLHLDNIINEESDRLCAEYGINYPLITMKYLPCVEAYPHQIALLFKNFIEIQ